MPHCKMALPLRLPASIPHHSPHAPARRLRPPPPSPATPRTILPASLWAVGADSTGPTPPASLSRCPRIAPGAPSHRDAETHAGVGTEAPRAAFPQPQTRAHAFAGTGQPAHACGPRSQTAVRRSRPCRWRAAGRWEQSRATGAPPLRRAPAAARDRQAKNSLRVRPPWPPPPPPAAPHCRRRPCAGGFRGADSGGGRRPTRPRFEWHPRRWRTRR